MKDRFNIILGGAGFIGSHLADKVFKEGETVWTIDSQEINYKKDATDFVIDISKEYKKLLAAVENAIDDYKTSEIIIWHCASVVGVDAYLNGDNILEENFNLNNNVYKLVKELSKHKFDVTLNFMSSSELYGNAGVINDKTPVKLNTFDGERNAYVLQKFFAEKQYLMLQHYNVKVKIFRLFNIIGIGQRAEAGLFPKIISKIVSKEDEILVIHSEKDDVDHGRSYMPVQLAVDTMYTSSVYDNREIVNIASDYYLSDTMVFNLILKSFPGAKESVDTVPTLGNQDLIDSSPHFHEIKKIQYEFGDKLLFVLFDDKSFVSEIPFRCYNAKGANPISKDNYTSVPSYRDCDKVKMTQVIKGSILEMINHFRKVEEE